MTVKINGTNTIASPAVSDGGDSGIAIDNDNVYIVNSSNTNQYLTINYQGIDFSNTAGISTVSTSNLLDHYEEGTWTPSFNASTPSLTPGAAATFSAFFVRIGKVFTVKFEIDIDVAATNVAVDDRFFLTESPPIFGQTVITGGGKAWQYLSFGSGINASWDIGISDSNFYFWCTHIDGTTTNYGNTIRGHGTFILP